MYSVTSVRVRLQFLDYQKWKLSYQGSTQVKMLLFWWESACWSPVLQHGRKSFGTPLTSAIILTNLLKRKIALYKSLLLLTGVVDLCYRIRPKRKCSHLPTSWCLLWYLLCGLNADSGGLLLGWLNFLCLFLRVKLLWGQKKKQLEDLNYCREEKWV